MSDRPAIEWDSTVCEASALTKADLAACIKVITEGDAVDPESAAAELPLALRVAVARSKQSVIGVAAIKRPRPAYASSVATKSRSTFPSDLPELGYVAVNATYQGYGVGRDLVGRLLASFITRPLFATTATPAMKRLLTKSGFHLHGSPWHGLKAELSLWVCDASGHDQV